MPDPVSPPACDVAVIGGGVAGCAAALLLLQRRPEWKVTIIEREASFRGRPGEGTPELAACFLGRTLGLGAHLNECHGHRHGARWWFTDGDPAQAFDASSEIGGKYLARLPAYLVDHAVLDEEMLRRATALGADCRRPAVVTQVDLQPGGLQTLTLDTGETLQARWVVDASGAAALVARQEGWRRFNVEHPTRTVWGRWRGVKDWDSMELRRRYPAWAAATYGMRNPTVNYLAGDGWWSAWAPVRGGEVSISVTAAAQGAEMPPSAGEIRAFLKARHPAARELLADATLVEGSAGAREDRAFHSKQIVGNGFALVGGAAGFIDRLYGAGLDWIACTVAAAVDHITGSAESSERVNATFAASQAGWFDAQYRDKNEYLGEFDLMSVAYLFDLGLFHLGPVRRVYLGASALPPFAERSLWTRLWRLVNRRCAAIARARRAAGRLGRSNANRRALFIGFNTNLGSGAPLVGAMRRWLWLELTEGWRSWR